MNQPTDYTQAAQDYAVVAQAIHYIAENFQDQPELSQVASHVGLSEHHFQRLFSRWAGISPKRFQQFLTKEYARSLLAQTGSLLDATYGAGLSSPGRLHDLLVTTEAMTPGQIKQQGAGLTIRYGFHPSPFGLSLLGATERGICWLSFVGEGGAGLELDTMQQSWCAADFVPDQMVSGALLPAIFGPEIGRDAPEPLQPLHIFIRGTNFQLKVWEALLRIPSGRAVTYGDVATWIGQPTASRAVGGAVGANRVAFLIPCHRILRGDGIVGNYRWGEARKRAMLGWEAARMNN